MMVLAFVQNLFFICVNSFFVFSLLCVSSRPRFPRILSHRRLLASIFNSYLFLANLFFNRIWKENQGKPPLTYRSFLAIAAKLKDPPGVVRTINADDFKNCVTLVNKDHDEKNFWYERKNNGDDEADENKSKDDAKCARLWPGGETAALKRFNSKCAYLMDAGSGKLEKESNRLFPNTTGLSPYLCLGCLSPRLFYHSMSSKTNEPRKHCLTPLSLQGQILWRDFFYTVSAYTPNFTIMKGNPICLQISWGSNDEYLSRWSEGKTGYPWIDAIMRQLREEGWIHHLARHAVACFLTRGDLWLSWEAGQKTTSVCCEKNEAVPVSGPNTIERIRKASPRCRL